LHAQAPHHPQRRSAGPAAMANRLKRNTVAELVEGRTAALAASAAIALNDSGGGAPWISSSAMSG
jgi:hypothetical protein